MAEQDYNDPSLLYFSIYEVKENNLIRLLTPRIRVDVPTDEDIEVNQMGEETKRAKGPRAH